MMGGPRKPAPYSDAGLRMPAPPIPPVERGGGYRASLRPPSLAHFSSISVVTDFGRSMA